MLSIFYCRVNRALLLTQHTWPFAFHMPHWLILPWHHWICCTSDHSTDSGLKPVLVISHRMICTFLKSTIMPPFLFFFVHFEHMQIYQSRSNSPGGHNQYTILVFFDEHRLCWQERQRNRFRMVKHWAVSGVLNEHSSTCFFLCCCNIKLLGFLVSWSAGGFIQPLFCITIELLWRVTQYTMVFFWNSQNFVYKCQIWDFCLWLIT